MVRLVGKDPSSAQPRDWFHALVYFVRGQMAPSWVRTDAHHARYDVKVVYYLSMEFLIGRSLRNHLFNLNLEQHCREALVSLGADLDSLYEVEFDAALGNGGLGRLAACFLDSMTTQRYPAYGYGIRYDAGMFSQRIEDGWQVEQPEAWLRDGNPWEFPKFATAYLVPFNGKLDYRTDAAGNPRWKWRETDDVIASAYDLQVSGCGQETVNTIRLWSARAMQDFDLAHFNTGRHAEAVRSKTESENLSRVLYPDDSTESGRELRLRQEYFFVSASLQDILSRFTASNLPLSALPSKVAIQLNDTHPALAIPEMMRLLMDERGLPWTEAWEITTGVFAYTNHTLLPEALETWPVDQIERLLPRHLTIIYDINQHFLARVWQAEPNDEDLVRRVSLIGEEGERHVRMAHLAIVGSHTVNGVSELHTRIMREKTFADFDALFPDRMVCKTNGITSRRWVNQANPSAAALVSSRIGDDWVTRLERLQDILPFAADPAFQDEFRSIKHDNKLRLAALIAKRTGIAVDPESLFDVQVKRIHEYKRQLLNVLHVVDRYERIRGGARDGIVPRTVVFAGKAAASYHIAKLIIKLINDVAKVVNADPDVRDLLRVVFIPNYDVSTAEVVIPAADLSEQISTAGTEASGTGNMKLALNGAITIGTRDGANIEIGEAVGEENIFFFGLVAEEVAALRQGGKYRPMALYESDPRLKRILDMIADGHFSPDDRNRFRPVVDSLLQGGDHYMLLADFDDYVRCQDRVDQAYQDRLHWTRSAIVNMAQMGRFSSDRTVQEYAQEIWRVHALDLDPPGTRAA